MRKQMLEAGKIVGTHGVRGVLRLQSWCDTPEFAASFKTLYIDEGTPLSIQAASAHKSFVLLTVAGLDTVEKAMALKGKVLYFKREDAKLPEGRAFVQDLIGLGVYDLRQGREIGTVTDILQLPGSDVYQVTEGGKEHLIPATAPFLREVDLEQGRIVVETIEGMAEDED